MMGHVAISKKTAAHFDAFRTLGRKLSIDPVDCFWQ